MRSQSTDDYLKALYKLEEAEEAVSTTALAKSMNVTAASATGMIQRLAREKLVDYRRYHGVRLSAEGRRIALQVIRNHRIVEMFLAEELNVPWDRVHDEAERWEHVISPEVVERMAARLGNPDRDPHGQPIPGSDGRVLTGEDVRLLDAPERANLVVVEVDDGDSALLRYAAGLGLSPGSRVEIAERRPFDGLLQVRIGERTEVVGHSLAERVRVRRASVIRRSGGRAG